MLEIHVNNERLQLPDNISINVTWESPFLLQERVPAPYSLSFSLPCTPSNLKSFGNPQRLTSSSARWSDVKSKMLFNSVVFLNGKLNLHEVKTKLKVNFQGDLFPDIIRDRLRDIPMDKFSFGTGSSFSPDMNSGWAKDYKDLIFSNSVNKEKFAVCPIRVENTDWHVPGPGELQYEKREGGGISSAMTMYFNFFNVTTGDYLMEDKFHMEIFPQVYINYLLDFVFGDLLEANPFRDDLELKTLVMTTSFHKRYEVAPGITFGILLHGDNYSSSERFFILNQYMSAVGFNEFLKSLLKIFCCSLIQKPNGKWDIIFNKSIISGTQEVDWTNKLTGKPTISEEKGKSYLYGFGNIFGDTSEEIEIENTSLTISRLLTANEGTYKITGTNQIFKKTLADKDEETDPDVYEYERLRTGLEGNSSDEDTYSMVSEVGVLPMKIDDYWSIRKDEDGISMNQWYVPEFSDDRESIDSIPFIGFNRGWINIATGTISNPSSYVNHYPFLTPFNKDLAGNNIGNYSLEWDGGFGLINKFHSSFKSYIEKDKIKVVGYFRLTELDLKNLDWKKKIFFRGKKFYLNKVETTIKKRSIGLSKCELIEA